MTTDTSTEAVERLLDGVTPGPWEWQTDTVIALDSRGYVIASTELCVHDEPEILANARLIAAARDLVPALLAERDAAIARAERADLPLTDAQLMADPRVKALVDVLEWALRYQPKDDSCESWVSDARLALAAFPAQGGE
jgi:hypothetical protein